jgi:hypothetical protein
MKILLFISLFIYHIANSQIIKLIKTSDGQFNVGAQSNKALDDLRGAAIGDSIHLMAGTDNFNVFNEHAIALAPGINWTYKANAPWSVRNAMGIAVVNGHIRMWSGKNNVTGIIDSWDYSPTAGWTQITATMTGITTACTQFAYAYTRSNFGSKYLTIGGNGQNDIKSSSDLISWTSTVNLSTTIWDTEAMTATVDTINGFLYIAGGKRFGGVFPGKMFKYSLNGSGTPTLVDSMSATWLQDQWPNIVWCTWGLLYVRGNDGEANQQGVYYCPQTLNPMIQSNWQQLSYEVPPRHASALFANESKTEAYLGMGNFWCETWVIKCLTCN